MERVSQSMKENLQLVNKPVLEMAAEAQVTKAQARLESALISMLGAIAKANELRDEYTSYHQSNVSIIATEMAKVLGLPREQCLGIKLGALVHDIGKIAVPSQILNRTSKLSEPERALLAMHPCYGAEIFRNVELTWPIGEIVEQHHERLDGSGYPKGLHGDQICLEARIVAVADTFDAMASDRPYRHALGVQAAVRTLQEGRGTLFDPFAVGALLALIDGGALKTLPLHGHVVP